REDGARGTPGLAGLRALSAPLLPEPEPGPGLEREPHMAHGAGPRGEPFPAPDLGCPDRGRGSVAPKISPDARTPVWWGYARWRIRRRRTLRCRRTRPPERSQPRAD